MKKSIIILSLIFSSYYLFAQNIDLEAESIIHTLNTEGGNFIIQNTDAENFVKLKIEESGHVKWFLDGEDMFIRDGNFEIEQGVFTKYEFLHIDGATGRIGFNILTAAPYNEELTSSVHLHGSIATRVRTLNGDNHYIIKQDDHIMIINKTDNSTDVMTLPPVADSKGREYIFKRNGNSDGKIEIEPSSGEKLNGVTDDMITLNVDNSSLEVVCDGTGWWMLSEISAVGKMNEISADKTLDKDLLIEVVFTSDTPIVLTLPSAVTHDGYRYEIKRNDATTHTNDLLSIKPAAGEFLDQFTDTAPYEMPNDWESVIIQSNGTRWLILSDYGH